MILNFFVSKQMHEICRYRLQEMYCNPSSFTGMEPPVVWSKVLGAFRIWITQYADDFSNRGMQALLWSFLEEVQKKGIFCLFVCLFFYLFNDSTSTCFLFFFFFLQTVCVTHSPATADAIMKDFHRQTAGDEKQLKEQEQHRLSLQMVEDGAIPWDETVLANSQIQQVMEQLVQIEFELYCGLEAKEMLGCQWLKKDKDIRSPAIVALTRRFNRVCSWVVTEILARADAKDRRDLLIMFISCASRARAQGALNCAMELVAALNNGAVQRLKKTWDMLPRKEKQTFDDLEEFVSSKGSYKLMRECIRDRREKVSLVFVMTKNRSNLLERVFLFFPILACILVILSTLMKEAWQSCRLVLSILFVLERSAQLFVKFSRSCPLLLSVHHHRLRD